MSHENKSIENQKGRILEYAHFDLKSFKYNSDEGLDIQYYNLLFPNALEKPNSKDVAHPDLKTALDQLKLYYATKLGLLEGWDFAREHCKTNQDSLQMAITSHSEVLERVKITGLTFAGEGESYGVSIIGYLKFPKKGGSDISSGKITFASESLGFEDDVEQICEEVKKEVYAYRFQNKKHQLDIETEIEKSEGLFSEDED